MVWRKDPIEPVLILLVFALLVPRLTIVMVWFCSNWFQGIFHTMLWPLLGFIVLPLTLLSYSAVQHWFGGQWTAIPTIGIVIAVLIDLSPARPRRRVQES